MKPTDARKQAVGHMCLTASFLATGGYKFLLFYYLYVCMVYKHAVVSAFRIYSQRGEDAAKRRGWRLCSK